MKDDSSGYCNEIWKNLISWFFKPNNLDDFINSSKAYTVCGTDIKFIPKNAKIKVELLKYGKCCIKCLFQTQNWNWILVKIEPYKNKNIEINQISFDEAQKTLLSHKCLSYIDDDWINQNHLKIKEKNKMM
jgi:hypothetical protein